MGKVRAMFDEHGKVLKSAGPSMPVEIMGFSDVPDAGDPFQVMDDPDAAKHVVEFRKTQAKKPEAARDDGVTLDDLFKKIEGGQAKELALVLKGDVQGSVEVLSDVVPPLGTEKVKIKIVHAATGNITEADVLLASASNAIVIGYNVKPSPKILELAKKEEVEIRAYKIIYQLTDDIKKAVIGLLEPVIKETYQGRAEVRKVFQIPKVGTIAGCYVQDGQDHPQRRGPRPARQGGPPPGTDHLPQAPQGERYRGQEGLRVRHRRRRLQRLPAGRHHRSVHQRKGQARLAAREGSDDRRRPDARPVLPLCPFPQGQEAHPPRLQGPAQRRHNVAVAEIDFQDKWQRARSGS